MKEAASVWGICNSSLTTGISCMVQNRFCGPAALLHYHGIASAIACRTFYSVGFVMAISEPIVLLF